MGLAINGDTVHGLAIGGQAFVQHKWKTIIASDYLTPSKGQSGNLKYLWLEKSTKLRPSSGSGMTLQDLIDKGKEITLIVAMNNKNGDLNILISESIDLTSQDPTSADPYAHHFNWITTDDSTNTWINYSVGASNASGQLSSNAFIIGSNTISNVRDNYSNFGVFIMYPYGSAN